MPSFLRVLAYKNSSHKNSSPVINKNGEGIRRKKKPELLDRAFQYYYFERLAEKHRGMSAFFISVFLVISFYSILTIESLSIGK